MEKGKQRRTIEIRDEEAAVQPSNIQVTDRRSWVQDEAAGEVADVPEKRYPSFVEELKARTELAERKLQERIAQLEAENDAFRRRLGRDMERRLEAEKLELFQEFLEVADNLERALQAAREAPKSDEENLGSSLESLQQGVQLNLELFLSKLKSQGVESIDLLNQAYDPHQAEAVGMVPVDDPELDQHVVEVLQPGYRCGEQLLRAARVRVGSYQPEDSSQE